MDSVTQFTLGACVGIAVLGRKIGPRRAALTGGVLGTLPDLDVFIAVADPVDSYVQHRGWSHSLLVHAALAPVFGETLMRFFRELRGDRGRAYLVVFLSFATHALLDAATVYGTRLFWPILTEPIGTGSIFIIDPLYTLPLLVALIWACCLKSWTPRFGTILATCFAISTSYAGWTLVAQQWVSHKAKAKLAEIGVEPDQMLAIPTPFNSIVWRVIGIRNDHYFNLYLPVFGGRDTATLYGYPRNTHLAPCQAGESPVAKVDHFSDGFYRLEVKDQEIVLSDLRMGLTPNYAFRFAIATLESGKAVPMPPRRLAGRGNIGNDLDWLLAKVKGEPALRPAEASARLDLKQLASILGKAPSTHHC